MLINKNSKFMISKGKMQIPYELTFKVIYLYYKL